MKRFPLKLNDDLWAAARKKAFEAGVSLHKYILDLLTKSVQKGS